MCVHDIVIVQSMHRAQGSVHAYPMMMPTLLAASVGAAVPLTPPAVGAALGAAVMTPEV